MYEFVNITRDNLRVHLKFDDSEAFKSQFNKSYYKDDFSTDKLYINRTDANQ